MVFVGSILPMVLAAQAKPAVPSTDYRARALAILKTVPLIDGHNDIPS